MFYKVELICHHEPHRCRCRHNAATQVNQEDLTSNLIKYNPSLLKYLGRSSNTVKTQQKIVIQQQKNLNNEEQKPYISIVKQKGLNFIIDDHNSYIPTPVPKRQPEPTSPKQQFKPHVNEKPLINNQTSNNNRKPVPQTKKQKELKHYHKDLRQQSRYLSNTAFRKYFDRQCFENYGNQNVHYKADGFVYNNYLKTYNINPHSGQNMPLNQQTFYHALVTASPQKYKLQTQQAKLSNNLPKKQLQKPKGKIESHSLQKNKHNVEKMLQDNLKHSRIQKKYQNLKLRSPNNKEEALSKVKSEQNIHHNNYMHRNIQSRNSPRQLQLQSRKAINIPQQASNQQADLNRQQNVYGSSLKPIRLTNRAQSTLIQKQSHQGNRLSCNHRQGEQSTQCDCCMNQMKALILHLSDSDPDLAERLLHSAKKATLYKNYALNNYQNASLNPHNYRRSDGKLNIFEK